MVNKDFNTIIQEIKIADENAINQKEIESSALQHISGTEEKSLEDKKQIEPEKKENEEEPKNEIIIEKEEEPKEKTQKKKKKHNKKKNKKKEKIFEIPQVNPYRKLFDFKEVSKSRFQDNSILRLINNWEDKDWQQTTPPTKDIDEQFPNQIFPQGEIQPYLKYLNIYNNFYLFI